MNTYTTNFYEDQRDGSLRSAHEIVTMVLRWVEAKSVVDVGCGVGTWLKAFQDHGVETVLGVDGAYVDQKMLTIPADRFVSADLQQPLPLQEKFDLAVSLEVAEHIPEQYAETFIESLTRLAPVVLFSAAVPFQVGTFHVNEQWPEYWAERFAQKGYVAIDCIRKRVWRNENVEWWYAQNIIVYVHKDSLSQYPHLQKEWADSIQPPLALVHPKKYLVMNSSLKAATDYENMSLRQGVMDFTQIMKGAARRRIQKPAA